MLQIIHIKASIRRATTHSRADVTALPATFPFFMLGGNIVGKTNTLSLEIYNCVFTGEFDRAMVLRGIIGTISGGLLFTLKRMSAI